MSALNSTARGATKASAPLKVTVSLTETRAVTVSETVAGPVCLTGRAAELLDIATRLLARRRQTGDETQYRYAYFEEDGETVCYILPELHP